MSFFSLAFRLGMNGSLFMVSVSCSIRYFSMSSGPLGGVQVLFGSEAVWLILWLIPEEVLHPIGPLEPCHRHFHCIFVVAFAW